MKILFDHQKFSLQRFGGISRYFANLDKGLNTLPGVSSRIAALYSENEYVKDYSFPLNNALGRSFFEGKQKRIYKWNRRFSRWNIQAGNFDVFHPTYYDPYFIKYIKKQVVVTVHDMVHELCPQYFPDAQEVIARKRAVITKADALIAISENTREDIIKIFPEKASSITVVYHGYTFSAVSDIEIDLPEKFILFVGERWHYKNFAVFAEAVSDILKKDKSLNLICAGGKSFTESEMELLNKLGIGQQCRQIDVSDEVLKQLYKRAQVFVFPSKHEGFGLPLLEAFANYCPVACSHTSSLPEIAGDAAQYFDPDDATSIRNAVETVLFNPNLREQLKQLGASRLQQFTFDQCLHGTVEVYRSLL